MPNRRVLIKYRAGDYKGAIALLQKSGPQFTKVSGTTRSVVVAALPICVPRHVLSLRSVPGGI